MEALVTDAMGRQAPEGLVGIHMNLLKGQRWPLPTSSRLNPKERAALARSPAQASGWLLPGAGPPGRDDRLLLAQFTRWPAAWMLDHDTDSYQKISRAFLGGRPADHLTRDRIVDNITLYWLTGTGASAAGVLGERTSASSCGRTGTSGGFDPGRLHHVPRRGRPRPRSWAEASTGPHLLQRGRQGGHFAVLGGAATLLEEFARRSGHR